MSLEHIVLDQSIEHVLTPTCIEVEFGEGSVPKEMLKFLLAYSKSRLV
jgi:hypothetical protein